MYIYLIENKIKINQNFYLEFHKVKNRFTKV